MKRRSTQSYKNKVGYICMNCGGPGNIAHHIVPLSKGGLDHPDNWMILCKECQDKEQVHKYADRLELPLAVKKYYFELGQEIPKSPEVFISVPHMTINLMHSMIRNKPIEPVQEKIEASTRPKEDKPEKKGPILVCPNCLCEFRRGPWTKKEFCNPMCWWVFSRKGKQEDRDKIKTLTVALRILAKAAQELVDRIDPQ